MSNVDHPKHYNAIEGIECIDVIKHFDFCLGSAIKYIWRAGLKSPDAIEDLEKADWYIRFKINELRKEANRES